nr:MAG TPA: hypothetical protein [Caudoviricetes sp.]
MEFLTKNKVIKTKGNPDWTLGFILRGKLPYYYIK